MEKPVLFEIIEHTAIITLNRPERRNAISEDLLRYLYDSMDRVTQDPQIKTAILTGAGKSFCAGLDLEKLTTDNLEDPRGDGKDFVALKRECPKPVIGAINGHAITGGFELALNCDFLIASTNAKFKDTHAHIGIHPGWGMSQLLQRAVGLRRAKQISFAAEFISADQAFAFGLVNEVVEPERLIPRALELSAAIAKANPEMLLTMKNLIEAGSLLDTEKALALEREGLYRFLQKPNALEI